LQQKQQQQMVGANCVTSPNFPGISHQPADSGTAFLLVCRFVGVEKIVVSLTSKSPISAANLSFPDVEQIVPLKDGQSGNIFLIFTLKSRRSYRMSENGD
jgi:hypothetical protein